MSAGREGSRQELVAGALAGLLGESSRIPVAGPRDPGRQVQCSHGERAVVQTGRNQSPFPEA